MRAGPEPASANSLTHASTRPPPGTDLSPLQTVFSCSIQPLDPRNAKVALGAKGEAGLMILQWRVWEGEQPLLR
jgi:hypothetical protein